MFRCAARAALVLVLVPGLALASPGKMKKAGKLLAKYESGDKAALVEGLGVMEAAIEHPKVERDPAGWALLGHLRYEAARGAADAEGLTDAAKELSTALEKGAEGEARERAIADLKSILGLLLHDASDALDARREAEAADHLAALLAVRQSLADAGVTVRTLEDRILTLAVRVSIVDEQLDDALAFHGQLLQSGILDAGIAGLLARTLAEAERLDDALALMDTLEEMDAGEPRLLRTHVELLMAAEDAESALARIDGQRERLWRSVSGALLLGELYTMADSPEHAMASYRRVIEQDERHVDGRLWLAALVSDQAAGDQETLDAGGLKWREKKELRTRVADARAEAVALLEGAWADDASRSDVGEALVAAHQAVGDEEAARDIQEQLDARAKP